MNKIHRTSTLLASLAAVVFTANFAHAQDAPLPDFVKKVQFQNCGGLEPNQDGKGVRLYRVPKSVRDHLTEGKNPDGEGQTGADLMMKARHCEIRFVVKDGEKKENVKLYFQSPKPVAVTIYWGDIFSSGGMDTGTGKPLGLSGHGLLYQHMGDIPRLRFANNVCRVIVDGADVNLLGIDGDVRPPTPEELAPVMMTYGTSITSGKVATRADLQWNSLTARALGYDLVNLGSSGTAFCEKEMADYIAAQPWDLCTLEISVNMVAGFTVEEFRKRATYMIDTLAKSHPKAPIFCISIFPWSAGDLSKSGKQAENTKAFREALKEICESSGHKNVHYVHGPDLLSFTGLANDLLHPSDQGMIEISQKLTPKIQEVLKSSPSPAK
ncbi:MAG: hypothetical protein K8R57_04580 [Verrucomicrobia bacterium]|nr:hypothetical protein [Verrucomicrobiota bacterium]